MPLRLTFLCILCFLVPQQIFPASPPPRGRSAASPPHPTAQKNKITAGILLGGVIPQKERDAAPRLGLTASLIQPLNLPSPLSLVIALGFAYEPLRREISLSSPQLLAPEPVSLRGSFFYLPRLSLGVIYPTARSWLNPSLSLDLTLSYAVARVENFQKTDRVTELDPGTGLHIGNRTPLGPGDLNLTLGYSFVPARSELLGNDANLQGFSFGLGYEYTLK